ncbi:MAG: hypothetical protein JO031_07520 [Ktedonobacteraceae bacterium]|nr:hypothetical protein [Ktedonobacteraceae bacterium]
MFYHIRLDSICWQGGRDHAVEDIHRDIVAAPFPHEWGKRADAINRVPTLGHHGAFHETLRLRLKIGRGEDALSVSQKGKEPQ